MASNKRKRKVRDQEFYTNIRGVTQPGRQKLLKKLKPGHSLVLIREPQNPADSNAIMVCVATGILRRKHCVGYLSADIAEQFAEHLDGGGLMSATVSEVTGGGGWLWWKKHFGCNIRLTVTA